MEAQIWYCIGSSGRILEIIKSEPAGTKSGSSVTHSNKGSIAIAIPEVQPLLITTYESWIDIKPSPCRKLSKGATRVWRGPENAWGRFIQRVARKLVLHRMGAAMGLFRAICPIRSSGTITTTPIIPSVSEWPYGLIIALMFICRRPSARLEILKVDCGQRWRCHQTQNKTCPGESFHQNITPVTAPAAGGVTSIGPTHVAASLMTLSSSQTMAKVLPPRGSATSPA